ncbi:type VII secretion protein EccCa [Actinomadura sp. DC4]|uniref:type VII secretion protein EccCa n=1 Tax=Actinomadura sp. DC4 TaxID=3055069 RepID=UPI00339D3995
MIVSRQERRPPPEMPRGEVLLESPPEIPETMSAGFQAILTYVPMAAGGGAMAFMLVAPGSNPTMFLSSGMMSLSMMGMMLGQISRGTGDRKQRLNGARRDYFRYLSQVRQKVRRATAQQREALEWNSPDPASLWSLVMSARLWERRASDADFGNIRIGSGPQRLAVQLIPPETKPIEDLEPMTAGALRRFVRAHSTVPNLPIAVSLTSFSRILPAGDPKAVRGLVNSLIAQAASFHSPDDLRIALCASPERMQSWDWMKWLPHAMHPEDTDAAGPVRLMAKTMSELEAMLGPGLKDRPRFSPGLTSDDMPYHIVIVDGGAVSVDSQLSADGIDGVTVIDLSGVVTPTSEATMLRLNVAADSMSIVRRDRTGKDVAQPLGKPDSMEYVSMDGLVRQLAPLRTSGASEPEQSALNANRTLTSLLGVKDPTHIDTPALWRPRAPRNRLRVPIGVAADGRPVEMDIKESAQGGMGPHGLVIGATGSGKSELLRTLVLGLAVTHSSEVLNFVLVDFKGGATFLGLDTLQHVAAVITNLEDELPLVDRMYDALHGEMIRRQEFLRSAGNYASLRDYEAARERGAQIPPMPTLFVVLDEFSELLSAKPEFAELFVMIGRLGRSLGVHLLLASQRLEEGKLRGLDTHLSYRIGLRTFSAMESRVVLGVPDAYELPSQPGNGYLKFDTTGMTRFKAAYVSGAYKAEEEEVDDDGPRVVPQIVPFMPDYLAPQMIADPDPERTRDTSENSTEDSLFDIIVRQLAGQGPPAHEIWLPPLDAPSTLDELIPGLTATPTQGFTAPGWEGRGRMCAPVGIVDRPFDQRRDAMWVDLSGAAGNVAVVGGPQSGKSTMLRSLIASLALLHTPQEVQFYCLDFGGGTLSSLASLPHVGGVASRLDGDRVRRTVAEMSALLTQREREFTERGIDSITTYRRLRAEGKVPGDGFGDVFLVIDNWLLLRQEFDTVEGGITDIAARGLGFGIHVVTSTNKWSEFRMNIRDLFGTRVELRLGDPYESEINRKLADNVPQNSPGRGLTRDGLHFLGTLPRVDGRTASDDLGDGVRSLVETVSAAWTGPAAPRVRLLPATLAPSALPAPSVSGRRIPIGIDEDTLSPVMLDFSADAHFIVVGDTESGKSNLLRLIAEGIVARNTPDQARLIFVDYRRSLLDTADTEHRIGYAAASTSATSLLKDVQGALVNRLPTSDLTPEQLRNRSWWKGSDLYLIIDDYELVATSNNPLMPIVELLPQARDIGLHVILARAMGGAGRGLYDPVIQRIKDMANPALILSGTKEEGALFGDVRARPLPPGRGYFVERRTGTRLIQTAFLGGDETGGDTV